MSSAVPPPDLTPAETSVAAHRIALVVFGCSVLSLLLVITIVILDASDFDAPVFLFGIGFIALFVGSILSIVGVSKRSRIDQRSYKLSLAGLLITGVVVVAIPLLTALAFALSLDDLFN